MEGSDKKDEKIKEPYPPEETPKPPQIIDPSNSEAENKERKKSTEQIKPSESKNKPATEK